MLRLKHIIFWITLAIGLVVTGAGASGQNITVYAEEPMTFTVNVNTAQEDNIIWEIYSDYTGINLAAVPGNCPIPASAEFIGGDNTGSSIGIVWHVPGIYLVKVRAINDCPTDNMEVYLIEVLESLPTAVIEPPGVICEGDDGTLTLTLDGDLPFTIQLTADDGINPPTVTTYTNVVDNPFIITVNPTVTTTYTITQVIDVDGTVNNNPSDSVTLIVNPRPTNTVIYQYTP